MPFMIGSAPVRRTLKYLQNCKINFRDTVKIFSISYNKNKEHHKGAKELVFWNLCQIQFVNPTVQCIVHENMTPTPFIKIYLEDLKTILIDLDSRTREEIYDHLQNLVVTTKTKDEIFLENKLTEKKHSSSHFGYGCQHHCLCEIPGQVPCPSIVPVPLHWRGVPPKNPKLHVPLCIRKILKENDMDNKINSE